MMDQVALWRGDFGDAYVDRNDRTPERIQSFTAMWVDILRPVVGDPPTSFFEAGCNVGINLAALQNLTGAELFAVEPNDKARELLLRDKIIPAQNLRGEIAQAISFPDGVADLAFTSGVLIHIPPDQLLNACKQIYRCAKRYVVCIEYFSAQPREIKYRGHDEALFLRDFGRFWMDNFPDLRCLGYGFHWSRLTCADDTNWWLFEKTSG